MSDEAPNNPVETPATEAIPAPQVPTDHERSVKVLDLAQRVNTQAHGLTQALAAGEDAIGEKAVLRKTLDLLNAVATAAGI